MVTAFVKIFIYIPAQPPSSALRWELDAEKQGSAILHVQLEELNKKSEATEVALERTARQYKEFKKHKEKSDLILWTLLNTSGTSPQT